MKIFVNRFTLWRIGRSILRSYLIYFKAKRLITVILNLIYSHTIKVG